MTCVTQSAQEAVISIRGLSASYGDRQVRTPNLDALIVRPGP